MNLTSRFWVLQGYLELQGYYIFFELRLFSGPSLHGLPRVILYARLTVTFLMERL